MRVSEKEGLLFSRTQSQTTVLSGILSTEEDPTSNGYSGCPGVWTPLEDPGYSDRDGSYSLVYYTRLGPQAV